MSHTKWLNDYERGSEKDAMQENPNTDIEKNVEDDW